MSEIVTTLEAHEGKNPGEAIASYGRSIVFLPKGVNPGQTVRVKLEEIREDSRGRMMYRAVPSPDEFTERWKDLGNGNVGLVTIATNWLLQESEEGIRDERPVAEREVQYTTRIERKAVWDQDLASSHVEQVEIKVFHTQRETVRSGTLSWEKIAEREERGVPTQLPIVKVAVGYGDWAAHKLEVAYQDSWTVTADAYFTEGSWDYARENTVWGSLPAWVQSQAMADYPVCVCGRSRRDTKVSDGYGKCEKCRAEEICVRCGKQAKVTSLNGRLVCDACKPYEQQEQLVAKCVPIEKREELAALAKALLTAEALPREAGEVILGSTVDHVESDWRRSDLVEKWKGYAFYYFTDQGVFGTKFSAAALQVLQFLPYAVGNQLVELMAWLSGYHKVEDCERYGDFYHDTQVEGQTQNPSLTESSLSKLTLAVRLRGSEAERIAALAGYQTLVEKLGAEASRTKAVANILQGNEQDYAAVLNAIQEVQELLAAQGRGEVLVDFSRYGRHMGENDRSWCWVINPDGSEVEPDQADWRRRYAGSEGSLGWSFIGPDALVLYWSRGQGGRQFLESWEVVKLPISGLTEAQTAKARELEPHERFRGDGTGFDLTRIGTMSFSVSRDEREDPTRSFQPASGESVTTPWPCEVYSWSSDVIGDDYDPDQGGWCISSTNPEVAKRRKAVKVAEEEVGQLDEALAWLEHDQEEAQAEYDQAETAAFERLDAAYGSKPIENGTVFEVTFVAGEPGSRDEGKFITQPFFDEASGTWVKLIADPYSRSQAKAGVRCYARVRSKNSTQLQLFAYRGPNPEGSNGRGGRMVTVTGYFAIPVYSSQDYNAEIGKTRAELEAAKQKLEQIRTAPITNGTSKKSAPRKASSATTVYTTEDEDGETESSMAAAFRKALQEKG